jgi:hypothetical protein
VLSQRLQPPEVLATKATPSGLDLDKGGMHGGLIVGVPGIVMAAVSVDDASKPILRGRARRQAADPVKLAGVELVHKTQHERMVVLFAADGHPRGHRRCLGGVHRPGMGQFAASIRREMDVPEQVEAYLARQPEPKQADLRRLHAHILAEFPGCRLWFTDGTNADGKVVANPNIGYGACTITYADGSSREFYRIGLSANTTGISVYVLGLDDKTYLARTYGGSIGKASITGYCIKFRHLAVINVDVLQAAIQYGMSVHQAG